MRRFLLHLLVLSSPLLVLTALYAWCDPFKVLRHYEAYYPATQAGGGVSLNPGFVGCRVFGQQHERMGYNAYILGNSRSIYYPASVWAQMLPEGASVMHFDAAAETLQGLTRKVQYIDRQGGTLRHVLFVVDEGLLRAVEPDNQNHLTALAPQLGSWHDALTFHWLGLRTFLTPKFLAAYLDYRLSGQLKPYMTREHLLSDDMFDYDASRNEMDFSIMERMIEEGRYYDERRCRVFEGVQHPDSVSPPAIGPAQEALLVEIQTVLARHHATATWVISPLYNQIRIHPDDVACLRRLFGAAQVHDYSGPNRWNADFHNYYEASHYRRHVAVEVLMDANLHSQNKANDAN